MPLHPWQTNFTTGEVSPLLLGRTDLQKYQNAAACLENFTVLPQGGAARRAGLAFVNEVKDSTKKAFLTPFIFNQNEAYVLEWGPGSLRMYKDRALLRFGSTTPATTMTLSGTTGDVTATAGAATFTGTVDIGREISFTGAGAGGRGVIIGFTSTTVVTLRVLVNFTGTSAASGDWTLTGLPVEVTTPYTEAELPQIRYAQSNDVLYIVHPNHAPQKLVRSAATTWTLADVNFSPPGTVEVGILPTSNLTLSASTVGTGRTATASGSTYLAADVGRQIRAGAGVAVITAVNSATVATVEITDAFAGTSFTTGNWKITGSPQSTLTPSVKQPRGAQTTVTASKATFRSSDVGKFLKLLSGMVRITVVNSSMAAVGTILRPMTATAASDPAGAWTLEDAAWSAGLGFPNAICFHEQRLFLAGTNNNPLTIWGSVTGDFENFATGADDEDALDFTLASNQMNVIRWMKPNSRALLIGTINGEFAMTGGGNGNLQAITPTNVYAQAVGTLGSDYNVDALRIADVAIMVQRGGRKIRELAYNFTNDNYDAPDLTILAEHLTRVRVEQLAHVRSPESYLLAVSSDGRLLSCAYERAENVVAWTPYTTQGIFESVAVIPNFCGSAEEVWVVVRRTINGVVRRFVEFFDGGITLDAASYYTGTETNNVRGLTYLNGQAVVVLVSKGSNRYVETPIVTNGAISLTNFGTTIVVGLGHALNLKTLRPEVAGGAGSQQTRVGRVNKVGLRLFCSEYAICDDEVVEGLAPGTTFTGDKYREAVLGWDNKSQIKVTLSATQPYKLVVLGIAAWFTPDDP